MRTALMRFGHGQYDVSCLSDQRARQELLKLSPSRAKYTWELGPRKSVMASRVDRIDSFHHSRIRLQFMAVSSQIVFTCRF